MMNKNKLKDIENADKSLQFLYTRRPYFATAKGPIVLTWIQRIQVWCASENKEFHALPHNTQSAKRKIASTQLIHQIHFS